jgi:hypothetical protein
MAVCTRLRFKGATPGQCASIHSHLKVEVDPPEGLILHAAGPVDGGWAMLDVWDSHEAFEHFTETRALPARAVPESPEIEEFPIGQVVQPDHGLSTLLR